MEESAELRDALTGCGDVRLNRDGAAVFLAAPRLYRRGRMHFALRGESVERVFALNGVGFPDRSAYLGCFTRSLRFWPAPGSEDTELGVLMELEVGHGETEVYPRVQA